MGEGLPFLVGERENYLFYGGWFPAHPYKGW